jgi:predicted DsbA family dithiol-disulfide isomerase
MHEALFSTNSSLEGEGIMQSARKLPIDASTFKSCLDGGKHIPDVLKDLQDAKALQLSGTPSFLIGRTKADMVEGPILMGAQPFQAFDSKIREVASSH